MRLPLIFLNAMLAGLGVRWIVIACAGGLSVSDRGFWIAAGYVAVECMTVGVLLATGRAPQQVQPEAHVRPMARPLPIAKLRQLSAEAGRKISHVQ